MGTFITSKRLAIFCYAATMLACVPGLLRLEIEQDVSRSLQPITGDEVEILKFQRSNYPSDYGSKIYVLIPDQNIEQWALAFREFHEDLESLENVYRVDSLINARHTNKFEFSDGEIGIEMGDFLSPGEELNSDLLEDAKLYGPFQGALIKQFSDGQYWAIINVVAQGPLEEGDSLYSFDAVAFNKTVSELIENHRSKFIGLYHVSEARISAEVSKAIFQAVFYMIASAAMIFFLVWIHSAMLSWKGVVVGLLASSNGVSGLLIAWAAMGYFGVNRAPITDVMVQMLIPLGAANIIHTHGYCKQLRRVTYLYFLRIVSQSFLFAFFSTALGYGITGVDSHSAMMPFSIFGTIGIAGSFFTTFFFAFPLMSEMKIANKPSGLLAPLRFIMSFRKRKTVFIMNTVQLTVVMTVISAFILVGVSRLKTDFLSADYLWSNNPVKLVFEKVLLEDSVYVGDVIVKGDPPEEGEEYGSVFEPNTLLASHRLGQRLEREFPGLRAIFIWEQLEQIWLDSGMTEEEFPDTKAGIVQELFVSFASQEDQELYFVKGDSFSGEPSSVRIILYLPYKGSAENRRLRDLVDSYARTNNLRASFTGRVPNIFFSGDEIVRGSDSSLLLGMIFLGAMFLLLLKKIRLTFAAMVVNFLPVLFNLSLLGWLSIERGVNTSIMGPISLCIIVDDTAHFLISYSSARKSNYKPNEAVSLTVKNRWEQIFATSVVIIVGFMPMIIAPLRSFAEFDILLSLTVGFAIFGDLVLLPSLLVTFEEMRFSMAPAKKAKEALENTTSVPHPQA